MRVTIDRSRCSGHGRCYTLAPDVFDCDDDGYSLVKSETVPPRFEAQARIGEQNCPEQAITLVDDA